MTTSLSSSLHAGTPTVRVVDNRGLMVRTLLYHRHPDTPTATEERITRQHYDAHGFLVSSIDPRLQEAGKTNFTCLSDLVGTPLRTNSVDAGTAVTLSDIAGRPLLAVSATGVTRSWRYEANTLPGRLLSVMEQPAGEALRITERRIWAGNTPIEQALNLAGQCVRHYDPAGLSQLDSLALNGGPSSLTRQLLLDTATADWQGEDESAWTDLLAGEYFTTRHTADAQGRLLTSTDARGNGQRLTYDVAGQLKGSWLTLRDDQEQVIVKALTYSAAGQKLREEHGNGVMTSYAYEPETQRLTAIKTERPSGHAAGAKVLQDLRYDYDPVGNVLHISDDAEATRFWRNQKVGPENTYVYDSLYQLVSATGREMASSGQQGSHLPPATVPLPADNSTYTNYTRTYRYDTGGNLTQIRHSAPATGNNYTTAITVSDCSNRAVLNTLAEAPAAVDALFDAGGHQYQLQPGQPLAWTPRGELQQVTPVVREGQAPDTESYRYDADSQRLLKVSSQQTSGSTQTQRVLYLPGLELRTTSTGGRATESLQVVTVGEAGRAQVRVLHYASGLPAGIGNNQVRYSYDNLIGSSGLEVDGSGNVISQEEYYPYGGTAVWAARSQVEAAHKTMRYSGKERDATGLYYYGYRYYQPWVGRWLSADPAGTVDELNLFKMVANNPATLIDNDGLIPITANFNKDRGDLVYGLGGFRGEYVYDVTGGTFSMESPTAPPVVIDLYNNTASMITIEKVPYDLLKKFIASPRKYEKRITIPPDIKELAQKKRDYPLWDKYFSVGEENEKFNLASIYKEVRKLPQSSRYHEWYLSVPTFVPKLLWKRGSKLGLEMAASGAGNKIHFVLDGLDMASVVSKEGDGGDSITSSELRYAYRNRERLGENILFYKNKEQVEAPWETDEILWSAYTPKNTLNAGERQRQTRRPQRASLGKSLSNLFKRKTRR
ncbi:RHS repeat-associated core domain-containing protein [Achromobacter sp.]|uniref:RHS repeat protein n=1 Tax=Achromobacter sp. TaxID=134375 RepID=UPI003C75D2EC